MADAQAWLGAVRGLGDNPLVTHLRLAEQRRLYRIPRWRRHLPLILVGVGLSPALLVQCSLALLFRGTLTGGASISFALCCFFVLAAVWLLQGVFECITGALDLLGRYNKQSNHLHVDDFTCLSSLTDHEILTGAVAVLLPPLLLRLAVIICGVALVPLMQGLAGGVLSPSGFTPSYAAITADTSRFPHTAAGSFAQLMRFAALLAVQVGISGILGSTGMILFFIGLGRGLNLERFSVLVASLATAMQAAHPVIVHYLLVKNEQFTIWRDPAGVSFVRLVMAVTLGLLVALAALAFTWARHSAGLRLALALCAPLLYWGLAFPLALIFNLSLEQYSNSFGIYEILGITTQSFAIGQGSVAVLTPALPLEPLASVYYTRAAYLPAAVEAIQHYAPTTAARWGFICLLQLFVLYFLAGFARDAVRARRRRGD